MPYSVATIPGLKVSDLRSVAFLAGGEDSAVNAKKVFEKLGEKASNEMLSRFDYWIDGGHKDNYFHGWPNNPQRKECFVFKRKEGRTHHRFYGFLMNPKPLTAPRFQVCILISHATKNEEHTDAVELTAVNTMRTLPEIVRAVKSTFPDKIHA
jgi:hypothetical protein